MATLSLSFNLVGGFKGLSIGSSSSSSFFGGDVGSIHVGQNATVSFPMKSPLTIESAHKKGAGALRAAVIRQGSDSVSKSSVIKPLRLAPLSSDNVAPRFEIYFMSVFSLFFYRLSFGLCIVLKKTL